MPRRISVRRVSVVLMDLAITVVCYVFAFLLRFEFQWHAPAMSLLWPFLPYAAFSYMGAYLLFSLYRGIYYFSSFSDLVNITKAVAAGSLVYVASVLFVRQGQFPRSVLIMQPILIFLGIGGIRFLIRFVKTYFNMPRVYAGEYTHVLLIGAGELGESLLRQMQKTPRPRYKVIGFLDDDPGKWGKRIHGVPVIGGRKALLDVLQRQRIDEVVIAIASRRGDIVRSVVESLAGSKEQPELKIAPSLEEMLMAPGSGRTLRRVRPADLLTRQAVQLDARMMSRFLVGKTVLVSGAGGTIGSELCRQVARFGCADLILVDNHATSLFYVNSELQEKATGRKIVPVLGDIRDQALIDRIFNEHKPHLVLHAAAHKHLHQLESNVHEGISNNVLGTYYLANAALQHGAESFLLVSTDKAVRPTSVMGATKRVAEMMMRSFSACSQSTRFAAVRFGNVLGSSGSVLEIFQRQIEKGGPLFVTHPDVKRYFMTVEESVQLILQAAAIARGGEIFLLQMGTPMKILDMAKNLVLLSGLEPGKEIEIKITGLKPGEKMEEELMEGVEQCSDSEHPSILILRSEEAPLGDLDRRIMDLEILSRGSASETLVRKLQELVPSFTPDDSLAASSSSALKSVDPTLS